MDVVSLLFDNFSLQLIGSDGWRFNISWPLTLLISTVFFFSLWLKTKVKKTKKEKA